jgi:acyl-CoA synthetase (AMP-forming)/AMP-acid ligase II
MPNTAEWPIVLMGAMETGIIVSTANPSYTGGKNTDTARLAVGRYKSVLWPLETESPQIRTL